MIFVVVELEMDLLDHTRLVLMVRQEDTIRLPRQRPKNESSDNQPYWVSYEILAYPIIQQPVRLVENSQEHLANITSELSDWQSTI